MIAITDEEHLLHGDIIEFELVDAPGITVRGTVACIKQRYTPAQRVLIKVDERLTCVPALRSAMRGIHREEVNELRRKEALQTLRYARKQEEKRKHG